MKFFLPAIFVFVSSLSAFAVDTEVVDESSLRTAITNADPDDTITFAPGLSGLTITLTGGQLSVMESITIDGSALPQGITISGDNASRVFEISGDVDVVFRGIRIADGKTGTGVNGAGIHLGSTATLILENVTLTGNRTGNGAPQTVGSGGKAGEGGGIFAAGDSLTILNSTISGNETGNGGNTSQTSGSGGTGGHGAGISVSGTLVTIQNSTIANNETGSGGSEGPGGTGGVGGYGGGIYLGGDGGISIRNSTITGNLTGDTGGLATPAGYGGGIYIASGTVSLANSIVAENERGDSLGSPAGEAGYDIDPGGGTLLRSGGNLIGENSDVETEFPTGQPNSNGDYVGTIESPLSPNLAPLAGSPGFPAVRIPNLGSPVIEAGVNADLPTDLLDIDGDNNTAELLPLDQRGLPRISGPRVDIGAVEDQLTYPALLASQAAATAALQQQKAAIQKDIKKTKKKSKIAKRKGKKAQLKKLKKKLKKLKQQLRGL